MKKVFDIIFKFKVPSSAGNSLDFRTKISDIKYAVEQFNNNFNFKEIKLIDIRRQEIELLFIINAKNDSVQITAKDLSVLSKRLYHDRGWSIYSRENAKLFTASSFKEVTEKYLNIYEKMPVIPEELQKSVHPQLSKDINEQMDDSSSIKAFEALINIQNVGDEETKLRRKKGIIEIKSILLSLLG